MVAGITGGIIGIAAAVLAIGLGDLAAASEAGASNRAIVPGVIAILVAVVGIVGAALTRSRASTSGVLQGSAAVVGFFLLRTFWIPSGLFLAVGGALALAAARRR